MQGSNNAPRVSLIAALSKANRAIGISGKLLWQIPGDLPRFKKLTSGHVVIMGLNTYRSIGRPLPNRTNVVVSNEDIVIDGAIVTRSIDEAFKKADEIEKDEIFVIGGGQIYAQTIDRADRLYLTLVDESPEADTFFPDYSGFVEKEKETFAGPPPHTFVILEK